MCASPHYRGDKVEILNTPKSEWHIRDVAKHITGLTDMALLQRTFIDCTAFE
jgi:hypothetical protein